MFHTACQQTGRRAHYPNLNLIFYLSENSLLCFYRLSPPIKTTHANPNSDECKSVGQTVKNDVMKKYLFKHKGIRSEPVTEEELISLCRNGKLDRSTEIAGYKGLGLSGEFSPITEHTELNTIIEQKEMEQEAMRKRREAEFIPSPLLALKVRDGETPFTKRYTMIQIKSMFFGGTISADSEFQHPDYNEWFPCASLFRKPDDPSPMFRSKIWDYYVLPLKVSGTTAGIISVFTSKNVKEESSLELARLGAEGWELISVIPVTAGAIGTSWSNAALAFLKRRRG